MAPHSDRHPRNRFIKHGISFSNGLANGSKWRYSGRRDTAETRDPFCSHSGTTNSQWERGPEVGINHGSSCAASCKAEWKRLWQGPIIHQLISCRFTRQLSARRPASYAGVAAGHQSHHRFCVHPLNQVLVDVSQDSKRESINTRDF